LVEERCGGKERGEQVLQCVKINGVSPEGGGTGGN